MDSNCLFRLLASQLIILFIYLCCWLTSILRVSLKWASKSFNNENPYMYLMMILSFQSETNMEQNMCLFIECITKFVSPKTKQLLLFIKEYFYQEMNIFPGIFSKSVCGRPTPTKYTHMVEIYEQWLQNKGR